MRNDQSAHSQLIRVVSIVQGSWRRQGSSQTDGCLAMIIYTVTKDPRNLRVFRRGFQLHWDWSQWFRCQVDRCFSEIVYCCSHESGELYQTFFAESRWPPRAKGLRNSCSRHPATPTPWIEQYKQELQRAEPNRTTRYIRSNFWGIRVRVLGHSE